jgi:hypothetical protein
MTWQALALQIALPCILWAQHTSQSIPVTTCQLETHPELYDHKLVEVRGRIYFGKFDFVIDSDCKNHRQARVWLDLGGDVEAPGAYWGILSGLPKQKGVDIKVEGVAVPLVHDAMLDRFVNDVGATRFRKPNGDNCGSECLFYDVTATIRGVFFSGIKRGFGMEQCCHLLVVEKVVGVSSKRNSVPASGEFQCTFDRWHPTDGELNALSAIPACSLRLDFKLCSAVFAKHWGDTIDVKEGLDYPGPWMSRDMTLSYNFAGSFIQDSQRKIEIKSGSYITREACKAVLPPRPAVEHVHCDFDRAGLIEDKTATASAIKSVNEGRETWRLTDATQVGWLAYQVSARRWDADPGASLKSAGCEHGTNAISNEPWAQCTWLASDDFQEVIVDLRKPLYLKGADGRFDRVPWVATGVEANRCRTEPIGARH